MMNKMAKYTTVFCLYTCCYLFLLLLQISEIEALSNNRGGTKVSRISRHELVSNEITHEKSSDDDDHGSNSDKAPPALEKINDATFTTASLMTQILRNNNDDKGEHNHDTVQYLDRVKNPEEVAEELESAAKYLLRQAHLNEIRTNGTGIGGPDDHDNKHVTDDESSSDLVRVFDGFVFLANLYDGLVRPGQFNRNGPTIITASPQIYPWFELDETKNEITVSLTLTQDWTDTRLAYQSRLRHPNKLPYVTLNSQLHYVEIWTPDTFILNEKRSYKHLVTVHNDLVRITPQGRMSRELKITVTVNCPFYNNGRFPFDEVVCSLNFGSFSWDRKNLRYRWDPNAIRNSIDTSKFSEFKGFSLSSIQLASSDFVTRADIKTGETSGLTIKYKLNRSLTPYITKVYLPLGSFCLIAIAGLIKGIGPEIGSALSYFMFGLQSIFMAISFNGPHFNWGSTRTALDSYYVWCVFTILFTGIVNLLQLRCSSSIPNEKSSAGEESYEMHHSSPTIRSHRKGTAISKGSRSSNNGRGSTVIREARFWRESDNFINDDNNIEENDNTEAADHRDQVVDDHTSSSAPIHSQTSRHYTGITGFILFGLKYVKITWRRLKRAFSLFCYRMNDFSLWLILAFFIFWNVVYWIKNLSATKA